MTWNWMWVGFIDTQRILRTDAIATRSLLIATYLTTPAQSTRACTPLATGELSPTALHLHCRSPASSSRVRHDEYDNNRNVNKQENSQGVVEVITSRRV